MHGQIAAATDGAFGDVRFTRRTRGSSLFVNPLTAMYFTVDLDKLAARCLYLDRIEHTWGRRQVTGRITMASSAPSMTARPLTRRSSTETPTLVDARRL